MTIREYFESIYDEKSAIVYFKKEYVIQNVKQSNECKGLINIDWNTKLYVCNKKLQKRQSTFANTFFSTCKYAI